MKKIRTLCFLLLLFVSTKGFSQKLSYLDLKYLIEHGIDDADNFLSKKGFEFLETEVDENGIDKTMQWAVGGNGFNPTQVKWLVYKYSFEANNGFIWYQFDDRETFDKIKTYCQSIGFKTKDSEINKFGNLSIIYENVKYTIKFNSGREKQSNKTVYNVSLFVNK